MKSRGDPATRSMKVSTLRLGPPRNSEGRYRVSPPSRQAMATVDRAGMPGP
jgi:hypothetical protein